MNAAEKKQKKNRPGIREIARLAKVSPTTVSFVLNGRAAEFGIAESTCQRIREVVAAHNYRQNIHGRAIMERKTFLVGVIIQNFVSSFWNLIIAGISKELTANGYHMLIADTGADRFREQEAFGYMSQIGVDGIITAMDFSKFDTEHIQLPDYWHDQHVVNTLHPLPDIPSVFTDHRHGTLLMAQELWDKGHRKVAFMGPGSLDTSIRLNENLRVFKEFFNQRGCEVALFNTPEEVLANLHNITAVFCRRDQHAISLYKAAANAGVKLPDDLSVAGYGGDCHDSALSSPKLTTIAECKEELGIIAARRLLAVINEKNDNDEELYTALSPGFVAGESIKCIG